jgi:hypothetical protein
VGGMSAGTAEVFARGRVLPRVPGRWRKCAQPCAGARGAVRARASSDVACPQAAELRVEGKQSCGAAWVVCVCVVGVVGVVGVCGCKKRKVRLATLIRWGPVEPV